VTSSAADLSSIQTPALIVDRSRMVANVRRMEDRCATLGVAFRPHLKTAKSMDVARLIPSANSHGITVSTVKEAEYFAGHGVSDILYAVGVTPDKLARIAAIVRGGATLRLSVDSAAAVEAVQAAATTHGVTFDVLVEIDSGEHRSGLLPDDPTVVALARLLDGAPGSRFNGVYTHGGHAYEATSTEQIVAIAEDERASVVDAAARCADGGVACDIVSVGSTPTLVHGAHMDGVTEARAGVCVFHDLYQVALGCCALGDIAATVLATVIGHQPAHGTVLVDAGGMALSKDRSTQALGPQGDCGYGLVADLSGRVIEGLKVDEAYQEHGLIRGPGADPDHFPLGSRVRVLPNHACMTAAAYASYHVVEGTSVVGSWSRVNEWV